MRLTTRIVELHIVQILELGARDEGVALASCVFVGGASGEGEDVRLAVLEGES